MQGPVSIKSILGALTLWMAVVSCPVIAAIQIIDVQVNSGGDDAEESNGSVSLTSSDLELTVDHGINQTIGIRFNNVNLPVGSTVSNAYIQFTVDEASSAATVLTIQGEASGNAAAFDTSASNISLRPRTAASVSWSPVAWPVTGVAGVEQRTTSRSSSYLLNPSEQ